MLGEFNPVFGRATLTFPELEKTPPFLALNEQQQLFVRNWVTSGGDQFFAFDQAYSSPSAETSRRGSYAVMNRKSIKAAIDAFLMKSDREVFLEEVTRISRSKTTKPSQIRALELRSQLQFGVSIDALKDSDKPAGTPEVPKTLSELKPFNREGTYAVGDRALFKGRAIVITALDSESKRATNYDWADGKES